MSIFDSEWEGCFSDPDISPEEAGETDVESVVGSSKTGTGKVLEEETRKLFHGVNILPDPSFSPQEVTKNRKGESVVECRGFQDVAPDLRRLRTPLLPFWWEKDDFEAFRIAQEHAWWMRRMKHLSEKRKIGDFGRTPMAKWGELALQGEGVSQTNNKSLWLNSIAADCCSVLQRAPLGPESLISSSCLRSADVDGETHLVFAKGNTVHVKKLSGAEDSPPFRYQLSEDQSRELVNYEVPLESRVCGFAPVPDPLRFAIRHRKSVSLLDLDGDILRTWRRSEDVLSVAGLPQLDGVAMLDASGSLVMNNYETLETINIWEDVFRNEIESFSWASVQESGTAAVLRVATRKLVSLFDVRSGFVDRCLFETDNEQPCLEVIGAVCQSRKHPFQFYCATSEGIHLIDERWSSGDNRLQSWSPSSPDLPIGCESAMIKGTEYVATYSSDGVVHVLANDWRHRLCRRRRSSGPPSFELSCQTKSSKVRYPVSRGRVVTIPAIKNLHNVIPFSSTIQERTLQVPWIGLTLLSERRTELSIFALNAAGTIFSCELEPADDDNDLDAPGSRENAENYFWLDNKTDAKTTATWLQKWDLELEESKFPKKSAVTVLSERPRTFVPVPNRKITYRKPIMLKINLTQRKPYTKKDTKYWNAEEMERGVISNQKYIEKMLKSEPKPTPRNRKFKYYRAIKRLKPIDLTEHNDGQGRRVSQIFEGEDAESVFNCSIRSSGGGGDSDSSRGLSEMSSLFNEDPSILQDFATDFDPFMTSTQQTEEDYAPLTASQSQPSSYNNLSIQKTPRKRKSVVLTGF